MMQAVSTQHEAIIQVSGNSYYSMIFSYLTGLLKVTPIFRYKWEHNLFDKNITARVMGHWQ
jgi:DNA-binding FadR family transcriptional regulator